MAEGRNIANTMQDFDNQDHSDRQNVPRTSSDSEREEKVARDKLKKASIANITETGRTSSEEPREHPLSHSLTLESNGSDDHHSKLRKKRSWEAIHHGSSPAENGDIAPPMLKSGPHKRMRSRDVASGDHVPASTTYENELPTSLEEEDDAEAEESPGGPGVLVDAPARTSSSPVPESRAPEREEQMTSPRRKRSREQFDKDEAARLASEGEFTIHDGSKNEAMPGTASTTIPSTTRTAYGEPEKKRPRDKQTTEVSAPSESILPRSGFANASSRSPFGSTGPTTNQTAAKASDSAEELTSKSAFASSGLSAFASSAKSPFGASASTSNTGGFGSATSGPTLSSFNSSSTKSTEKMGLGQTNVTSPFGASKTAGFGSLGGSGFGLGNGTGFSALSSSTPFGTGGLSSFASPASTFGTGGGGFGAGATKSKAFGEPQSDEEDDISGTSEEEKEGDYDEEERGLRVKPTTRKPVEYKPNTGEENEETLFSCRAKLFVFEGKEWKERGIGTLKLNESFPDSFDKHHDREPDFSGGDGEDSEAPDNEATPTNEHARDQERKARLIMRAEGTHRVILNTPVFRGMAEPEEASGKVIRINGFEEGEKKLYSARIGKEEVLKELWRRLHDLQNELAP